MKLRCFSKRVRVFSYFHFLVEGEHLQLSLSEPLHVFFSIRVLHFGILCERANVSHPIPSNRHANGTNAQIVKLKRLRKHHYDDHSHLCFPSSFALRCFALVHARCCSQVPFSSSSFTFLGYS